MRQNPTYPKKLRKEDQPSGIYFPCSGHNVDAQYCTETQLSVPEPAKKISYTKILMRADFKF
jgi:hypothetical protein